MATVFPRFVITRSELPELERQAEAGDASAQLHLATLLHHGILVKQDAKLATAWVRRAAEAGDVRAMATLAWCFDVGSGVRSSAKEAFRWQLGAAEAGDPASAYGVAIAHREGRGVKKDLAAAVRWLDRAAELAQASGDSRLAALSLFILGMTYCDGGRGLKADIVRGERALSAAADLGNADACCDLARRLRARSGDEASARAASLYLAAAEQGHPEGAARVAGMLVHGEGIRRDPVQAARWAQVAALQRDVASQLLLGRLLNAGESVARDESRALFWFLRAAAEGMHGVSDEAALEAEALRHQLPSDQVTAIEALAGQWSGGEPDLP